MKSRHFLAASLCIVLAPTFSGRCLAQQRVADRVIDKMGKTEILYNILPILMTKKQILDLLPVLEKARDNVKKTMAKEDELLGSLESGIDAAYQRAIEKNLLPSEAERVKIGKAVLAYRMNRDIIASQNVDLVQPVLDKILNVGQRKAAANSLNVKEIVPGSKPEELSDSEKERIFIRYVLLDPAAYDMLTDMAKARKE